MNRFFPLFFSSSCRRDDRNMVERPFYEPIPKAADFQIIQRSAKLKRRFTSAQQCRDQDHPAPVGETTFGRLWVLVPFRGDTNG